MYCTPVNGMYFSSPAMYGRRTPRHLVRNMVPGDPPHRCTIMLCVKRSVVDATRRAIDFGAKRILGSSHSFKLN